VGFISDLFKQLVDELEEQKQQDLDVQALLSKYRLHINEVDEQGNTLLHIACYRGCFALVRRLVAMGADTKLMDTCGHSILYIATYTGDIELMQFLIDETKADLATTDVQGNTLLHAACYGGRPKAIEFLLEKGLDINKKDNRGSTPLKIACCLKYKAIVKLLIEKGANVDILDGRGNCVLQIACLMESEEIVSILLAAQPKIDNVGPGGHTALFTACCQGLESIVRLLLNHGANPKLVDDITQVTPLDAAYRNNYLTIVEMLTPPGFGHKMVARKAISDTNTFLATKPRGLKRNRGGGLAITTNF